MEPVIRDWSDAPAKLYSGDRFWSRVFLEAARYLSEKAAGTFLVDAYPNPSPLDIANLLRGNDLFTDFHDEPEQLKGFLRKAADAAVENAKAIRNALSNLWGGTYMFNKWIPGGLLLLEDAADLCSPGLYEEFGKPYTQQVIREMGGAYIHHHSLGRHQFANMASLEGLFVEQISSDPNCARPIRDPEDLVARLGGCAADLECTPEEVYGNIDGLKRGRFILWVECGDAKEAAEVTRFVRLNSVIRE
jgi:hypothetical protein